MPDNLKTYTIKIKNTENLILPKLGDSLASGYDIVAAENPEIVGEEIIPGVYKNIQYIQYKTGIHLELHDIDIEQKDSLSFDFEDISRPFYVNGLAENQVEIKTYLQCFVFPRSSITKYKLMLLNSAAIIDSNYIGEIILRYNYRWSPEDVVFLDPNKHPSFGIKVDYDKIYKKGDKCAQLVFSEISPRIKFNIVDKLEQTERNDGAFGSTGK